MPPLCIAHRGGAALAPENTLAAFANAIALGADGAELDVHLTRDSQVVVTHDFRLNCDLVRDLSGNWLTLPTPRIRELTVAELAQFDVGRAKPDTPYAREHPLLEAHDGERVPLLSEVVALARGAPRPFQLFIEIKTSLADPDLSASPEELAEATVAVLAGCRYIERSILVGFDWRALIQAQKIEPSVRCWFSTRPQSWFADGDPPLADDPPPRPALEILRGWARKGCSPWAAGFDAVKHGGSLVSAIKAAGGNGWFACADDPIEDAIAQAHASGLQIGAWTVNDPDRIQALAAAQIDAICTDRPDLMSHSAR